MEPFFLLKKLFIPLIVVNLFGLNACSSESAITALPATVVLLDISRSSANFEGTYNEEDHSPSSLSERKKQLEQNVKNAISSRTAVYFGFVRNGYGVTEIATLVPATLILEIESVLKQEILNDKIKKEAKEGISEAWQSAVNQEQISQDSCSTEIVAQKIVQSSNATISTFNAEKIAGKLCSGARNSIYQFDQLVSGPENIGSDIQAAIDRSLQKIASDQRRLINSDGKTVQLIPTLIVISYLIQVTNGLSKTNEVSKTSEPKFACELARDEAKNFTPSFIGNVALISDGFAGTKKEVKSTDRDKLKKYWECWFETRGITDIDLGAKGIDVGAL